MPDLEKLNALKEKIRKGNISRKELAIKIGVPYGTLSNYLNGFYEIPEHVLTAIETEISICQQ
jgi:DNA transposition AAA+ family ATPase